jgi:hypothetical protein
MIIKILLFGQFGGDREQVVRNFGRAELLDYDTPLTSFVNSSFKQLAAEADVAIHGGEPKYKPYITAARKNNCKLALWGCEPAWITRCHAVLPLFDLIFARDKDAFQALRGAGYENVVLPKSDDPLLENPEPVTEPEPLVEPEPIIEPEPVTEPEPMIEPEPIEEPEPVTEPVTEHFPPSRPLLDAESLPAFEIPDLAPLSGGDPPPTVIRFEPGLHAYGVVNRNENVRAVSAAGGVFTLLCEEIIARGGLVFGARYDGSFETVQAKADRMPECSPMRGVKYAFGETEGIYAQAVSCLHQGKPVLFTGIPCQVEKLYSHLPARKPDHPLLITAGIVCGGTVDPAVFAAYLRYVGEKNGAPATAVDMSGKPMSGSGAPAARIGSENGTYDVSVNRDPFHRGYRAGLFLRPECYNCPHRGERRKCDLTLGSFPAGRKHIPGFDDNKGASLVLAHTQKGRDMMDALVKRAIVCEVPPDALSDYNPALVEVPERHKNHDRFFADMQAMRFDKAVSRSVGPAFWGVLSAARPAAIPKRNRAKHGLPAAEKSIIPLWKKLTSRITGRSKALPREPGPE